MATAGERTWETTSGGYDKRTKEWREVVKEMREEKEKEYKQNVLDRQFAEEHKDEIVDKLVAKNRYDKEKSEREAEATKLADAKTAAHRILQIDGVNNEIELAAHDLYLEKQKEAEEKKRQKEIDKHLKKLSGEAGFRGLIKSSGEWMKEVLDDKKTTKELFEDLTGAFKSDFQFVKMALGPLLELPGVNSALAIIVFSLKMLWKGIKTFWAWRKAESIRSRLRRRMESLRNAGGGSLFRGVTRTVGSWLTRLIKFIPILFLALLYAVGQFFKVVTAPFRFAMSLIGKLPGFKQFGNLFRAGNFFGKGGTLRNFFRGFGIFKEGGFIARNLARFGTFFRTLIGGPLFRFMGALGRILGWIIAIPVALWGFMKGILDTANEGIIAKIIGGLYGALGMLADFFIFGLMDLAKDIVSWIADRIFGEAEEGSFRQKWQDFGFSDMWNKLWGLFTDGMLRALQFLKAISVGVWDAMWALGPGGVTPQDAFKKGFAEVMNEPAGLTSVSGGVSNAAYAPNVIKHTGEAITNTARDMHDAQKEAQADRASAAATTTGNTNVVNAPTNINNSPSNIVVGSTTPIDAAGVAMNASTYWAYGQ